MTTTTTTAPPKSAEPPPANAAPPAASPLPPSPPPPPPPPPPQQPPKTDRPHVDGKEYYGYLIKTDKTPTDLLSALLRAIGKYISTNIGDTEVSELDPKKLAAFYHAVGGNYDSLFLNAPDKSISYIWQALGVQHNLHQPPDDDFSEPSIPTLTIRGWVRWESLQILLGPEEHVPFIQFAVRNWNLKNPDTGETFPPDLPREALPLECDPDIDAWHKSCADRLRNAATPKDEYPPQQQRPTRDPRVHAAYSHVRGPQPASTSPRRRPEMDYFNRERPPPVFTHIPGTRYAGSKYPPNASPDHRRVESNSSDEPPRRRSLSDVPSPHRTTHFPTHLHPERPSAPPRRHSQPRMHADIEVSSDSDSDDEPAGSRPSSKSRAYAHMPPPSSSGSSARRAHPSAAPSVAAASLHPHHRPEPRPDVRPDDHDVRRRGLAAEMKQRLSSLLPGGISSADRRRSSSREHDRHSGGSRASRYPGRDTPPSARRSHGGYSDESYPSEVSDDDASPKHRIARAERERERALRRREIERERGLRFERELRERERLSRKDGTFVRPVGTRRPSSHADAERRPKDYPWDARDRERERERERGRKFDLDGRRIFPPDDRDRERDRRRYKDRGPSPVMTGVGGRRYVA